MSKCIPNLFVILYDCTPFVLKKTAPPIRMKEGKVENRNIPKNRICHEKNKAYLAFENR